MKEISITGQKREALGKKASKAIRKQGMIPCNPVSYTHLTLPTN